jgi:biopolymer transport protein ExbD
LIPFIDFLLCLVAFLLVTAVWSQMARLQTNAQVPGDSPQGTLDPTRELHVETRGEGRFLLSWKENGTVINAINVEKQRVSVGDTGDYGYPELAAQISSQWSTNGQHRSAADPKLDRAVLHIDNTAPFSEIAAIIDALHAPKRSIGNGNTVMPAFSVAFAVN